MGASRFAGTPRSAARRLAKLGVGTDVVVLEEARNFSAAGQVADIHATVDCEELDTDNLTVRVEVDIPLAIELVRACHRVVQDLDVSGVNVVVDLELHQ
jgi:hypothetical protein